MTQTIILIQTNRLLACALREALRISKDPDDFKDLRERKSAIINWKIQAESAIRFFDSHLGEQLEPRFAPPKPQEHCPCCIKNTCPIPTA